MAGALERVKLRNEFYRDNYRRVVLVLLWAVTVIALQAGIIFYMYSNQPTPKYFATNPQGTLVPMVPLEEPYMTPEAILQWSVQAVTALYTYNFVDFREKLQATEKYFTSAGRQEFLTALQESKYIQSIQEQKLIVTAVVSGAPVIIRQGLIDNRYAWQMQIPLKVTYQTQSQRYYDDLIVQILVTRVSTLASIEGIGIAQITATHQKS